MIDNGYKILFENAPTSYSFENGGSTNKYNVFVSESILELLERGCIKELSNPSEFCNPLHIAVQSSGKLRLILDLSHLNTIVIKKSFKYGDLRTVLQIFDLGIFAFTFDLKSAYHHIDICDDHVKYLSFKWCFGSGKYRFFAFQVLPFGLSSAPYIFSKVMRQLLKHCRSKGYIYGIEI